MRAIDPTEAPHPATSRAWWKIPEETRRKIVPFGGTLIYLSVHYHYQPRQETNLIPWGRY